MQRRRFVFLLGSVAAAGAVIGQAFIDSRSRSTAAEGDDAAAMQQRWREFLPAGAEVPTLQTPVERSGEEWREVVSQRAYEVLFEEDTERAFTSPLNDEKRPGVYACAACGLPLFSSEMKYDSGTGWPSFFTHIPNHLDTKPDYYLIIPRTEYHCARCGGHQGHVFNDGPPPTGKRWCNNGVALTFIPQAGRDNS